VAQAPTHRLARRLARVGVGFALAAVLYLLLVDTTSLPELYAGAAIVLLAALGFGAAREQQRREASFRAAWLPRVWSAVARIPGDALRLVWELVAQLLSRRRRRGVLRAVPFRHGGDDSGVEIGRRAATELLGSLAPNTIVIGVDPDTDLLLVHQLRRSGGREQIDVLRLG
jgi:hypothetical protein